MALQQGQVTITGNLGADPQQFGRNGGRPACVFRLGCTRRYQDRNGVWQQLPTTWITVKAFRGLAMNIMRSFHKGDAVIVVGLLGTEQWRSDDGADHSRMVIEASNAGPDLNYAVTSSVKTNRDGALVMPQVQAEEPQTPPQNEAPHADPFKGSMPQAAAMLEQNNAQYAGGNGELGPREARDIDACDEMDDAPAEPAYEEI